MCIRFAPRPRRDLPGRVVVRTRHRPRYARRAPSKMSLKRRAREYRDRPVELRLQRSHPRPQLLPWRLARCVEGSKISKRGPPAPARRRRYQPPVGQRSDTGLCESSPGARVLQPAPQLVHVPLRDGRGEDRAAGAVLAVHRGCEGKGREGVAPPPFPRLCRATPGQQRASAPSRAAAFDDAGRRRLTCR